MSTTTARTAAVLDDARALLLQVEDLTHQLTVAPPGPAALYAAHAAAAAFYRSHAEGSWVGDYLRQRGLALPAAGYAPADWTALTAQLKPLGYTDQTLIEAGLAIRSRRGGLVDRFRDRLMLPIADYTGSIVAFVGRENPDMPTEAKYLNSPTTAIYSKSEVLYGLGDNMPLLLAGARLVLCEGALDADAITAAGDGQYVGLASLGTALTSHHLDALDNVVPLQHRPPMSAYDADTAGIKATVHAHTLLSSRCRGISVLPMPDNHDPAQVHAVGGLAPLLARGQHPPAEDVLIGVRLGQWRTHADLRTVEGKIAALRDVARVAIAGDPGNIPRYAQRLAAVLDIDRQTVLNEVLVAIENAADGSFAPARSVGAKTPTPPAPNRAEPQPSESPRRR